MKKIALALLKVYLNVEKTFKFQLFINLEWSQSTTQYIRSNEVNVFDGLS